MTNPISRLFPNQHKTRYFELLQMHFGRFQGWKRLCGAPGWNEGRGLSLYIKLSLIRKK